MTVQNLKASPTVFKIFTALSVLGAVTCTLATASATTTITSATGASTVYDLANSPTIMGGIAGADCSHSAVSGQTCNSCVSNGLTGDMGLVACNDHRVYPSLQLKFTIVSDQITGTPLITYNGSSAEQVLVAGPRGVPKGTPVTIGIAWSVICKQMNVFNGSTFCNPVDLTLAPWAEGEYELPLNIGISADGQTLANSGAEMVRISVHIRRDIGQNGTIGAREQTLSTNCDAVHPTGFCYFEVGYAGGSASVVRFHVPADFPSYENNNDEFQFVRFLYSPVSFAAISPASPHVDLAIGSNPNDGSIQLNSSTILTAIPHNTTYYFKAAVIDSAGNVGFYTPAAEDADCQDQPPSGLPLRCHTITSGNTP
jgi:hypothetical protein